ncbi:MAG: ABC transporter ATP-binding protein [Peptococcaceae bacterium]|nr:ABC transporter ATP-binding protein [Peptococcaceae bacterium]
MIELRQVSKSFTPPIKAVDNIDLMVNNGEIFGFLGPNGAGKTTTIKMITGILAPDSGSIKLDGLDIVQEPLAAKKRFGFVSDNPNLFLRLKGLEYLNFIADIYDVPAKDRKDKVEMLSSRFEMTKSLGDRIQSYSHGMRQKIIIMGVLIHNPSVWIMDEPMTGLDPKAAFTLKEMMREHADKQNTVFFSTHVLDVAEKICDRVAVINKGQVLFCGKLTELKDHFKSQDESLEKMFLEMTGEDE